MPQPLYKKDFNQVMLEAILSEFSATFRAPGSTNICSPNVFPSPSSNETRRGYPPSLLQHLEAFQAQESPRPQPQHHPMAAELPAAGRMLLLPGARAGWKTGLGLQVPVT